MLYILFSLLVGHIESTQSFEKHSFFGLVINDSSKEKTIPEVSNLSHSSLTYTLCLQTVM